MKPTEIQIIKDYSFIKKDISDIREAFICMNADAKDKDCYGLKGITESLIYYLELISDDMNDEDEENYIPLNMCDN